MHHNYQASIENSQTKQLDTLPPEATTKPNTKKRQLGFMKGEMTLPDDINWGDEQVGGMFEGSNID